MRNILHIILILIISITVISCAKESGGDGTSSTEQNKSPSSHARTTFVSSSSDCPNGGVKIEMGIDDNMNGTLDSDEVDKTEYACNGVAGIKPSAQIACDATLENTSLAFEYKVTLFTDGSLLVHGSIYGNLVEVTDSTFYDSSQNGATNGYINIRYDVEGSANGGDWKIGLNRTTLVTTVTYVDSDLSGGSLSWTLSSSQCTKNEF